MDAATADLRLLADPTRRRILALIAAEPEARALVGRLADELQLTQPTVSHHAKAMTDAGLLRREPDGRRVWYSIAPDHLDRVLDLVGGTTAATPDAVLERIAADLAPRFAGVVSRESVDRVVRESHDLLADGARITRYLPSLTARFAAERLAAISRASRAGGASRDARATGTADAAPGGVPEVLFVCVQNAGRSQMAAAILRQLAGDSVRVRTAGSEPADAIRPAVVAALDEIGVPLGGEFPKPLTDEVVRAADVVVTMGCGDACPVYPGRRYLDWDLEDPVGLPLERVREIRDDIERRVRELLPSLDKA